MGTYFMCQLDPRNLFCWWNVIIQSLLNFSLFLYFLNRRKEIIHFVDLVALNKRKYKKCCICELNSGYCINVKTKLIWMFLIFSFEKCEFSPKCKNYYHVSCARKENLIFHYQIMNFYLFDKSLKYIKTYCPEHLKSEFSNDPKFQLKAFLDSKMKIGRTSALSTKNDRDEIEFQYNRNWNFYFFYFIIFGVSFSIYFNLASKRILNVNFFPR